MVRRLSAALAAAIFLALSPALALASQADEEIAVEQVQIELPTVMAYFYAQAESGGSLPRVSATLGGESLAVESVRAFDPSLYATDYYYLVDCSTSTRAAQLEAVKEALLTSLRQLGPNDTVTLLSFGLGVDVLTNRSADVQAMTAAIEGLKADLRGTVFFDALAKALELAHKSETALTRKVAFVFSDSVDVNIGGHTKEEIDRMLSATGMPFYALGFDTGSKAELDAFGAIARLSGGAIEIVSDKTLPDAFAALLDRVRAGGFVATLRAGSNIVQGTPVEFTLRNNGTGAMAQAQVPVRFWQPDEEPPAVKGVSQSTPETLLISFSEEVLGAQSADSYVIRDASGNLLGIRAAAYKDGLATLTFSEVPLSGDMTIECPGVTDASMEKNPVAGAFVLAFEGATPTPLPTQAPEPVVVQAPQEGIPTAAWFVLTIAGVAVVAAIVLAVIKKRGGLVVREGKVHFAGQLEVEQPVAEGPQMQVHFVAVELPVVRLNVTTYTGESRALEMPINKTLFVGRADICDIYFDDTDMSRQHFVIEEREGLFTITNLSETNGTLLNGVPIGQTRPLNDGDRIEAGRESFVFYRGKA